jgi:hypothetical protein
MSPRALAAMLCGVLQLSGIDAWLIPSLPFLSNLATRSTGEDKGVSLGIDCGTGNFSEVHVRLDVSGSSARSQKESRAPTVKPKASGSAAEAIRVCTIS